jgi:hypothetical protein
LIAEGAVLQSFGLLCLVLLPQELARPMAQEVIHAEDSIACGPRSRVASAHSLRTIEIDLNVRSYGPVVEFPIHFDGARSTFFLASSFPRSAATEYQAIASD